MEVKTWGDWGRYHSSMFGLHTEREAEMILLWSEEFQREKYSVAEAVAATRELAKFEKPPYKTEQLNLLMGVLYENRRRCIENGRNNAQRKQFAEDRKRAEADPVTPEQWAKLNAMCKKAVKELK